MNTRLTHVFGALFLGAFFATGCGPTDSFLSVSFSADTVPADGKSTLEIEVTGSFQNKPLEDGTKINLVVSGGSFEADRVTLEDSISTTAGSGIITWYAPQEVGEVSVQASYTDPYNQIQQAQDAVQIVEPPPVQGSSFDFFCSVNNLGAPQSGEGEVRVPCTVNAVDEDGKAVDLDDIRFGFLAETGKLEVNANGELEFVITPGETPKDIDPAGDPTTGEPRWVSGGATLNPRDGIITLVVHTNGLATGQPDAIQGEPYVDANDNGTWDVGETFVDIDDNAAYTPPGAAGGPVRIWRWFKMMLTGPVHGTALESAGIAQWTTDSGTANMGQIALGASKNLSVVLVDKNLNPVASHGNDDKIEVQTDQTKAAVIPTSQPLARDNTGMVFNNITGALDGRATRTGYLQGTELNYSFKIQNSSTSAAGDLAWTVDNVVIKRTPAPGERTLSETLPVTAAPFGTLE